MSTQLARRWVEHQQPVSSALQTALGLGAEPVYSHEHRAYFLKQGTRLLRCGFGDALSDAATGLINYFASNPCSPNAVTAVSTFQSAYNAIYTSSTALTVDGKYGQLTQQALTQYLNDQANSGAPQATGTAPDPCFDANGNYIGPVPAGSSNSGGSSSTTTNTNSGNTTITSFFASNPWLTPTLVAVGAVGAGYIGYKMLHRKGSRSVHHHHHR